MHLESSLLAYLCSQTAYFAQSYNTESIVQPIVVGLFKQLTLRNHIIQNLLCNLLLLDYSFNDCCQTRVCCRLGTDTHPLYSTVYCYVVKFIELHYGIPITARKNFCKSTDPKATYYFILIIFYVLGISRDRNRHKKNQKHGLLLFLIRIIKKCYNIIV
jgi:hypothetical protein